MSIPAVFDDGLHDDSTVSAAPAAGLSYAVSRSLMAARIREIAARAPRERRNGERSRLFRIAVSLPPTDPLQWLRAQVGRVKLYWCDRADNTEVAGLGEADRFAEDASTEYATMLWRLRSAISTGDAGVRYYGGLRFDQRSTADSIWAPFGRYLFHVPRFEVHTRNGRSKLICNLAFPRDWPVLDTLLDRIARMPLSGLHQNGHLGHPIERTNIPDLPGWRHNVEQALAAFRANLLKKVVLARRATLAFAHPLDPLRLLQHLKAATPNCFHFAFQPEPGTAFIGASPERLYERRERSIWSEAVAGTRPRGHTQEADAQLAHDLRTSEKDRREHEYVRRSIIDRVGPLCDGYEVDEEPSVMKLANGQHLQAQFHGTLRDDITDADLLQALHPTPAVGGYPRRPALDLIAERESFDRGWYAGPVGWIGAEAAEFAVAIRSGLVHDHQLALFSGAGIVEGSEPESEWTEIEQKLEGFTRLFTSNVAALAS